MTAVLTCPRCGAVLRPTAKFCGECGSPSAASGPPAEYKQVTVLFADVVHSMEIAAAVGAERLREIMAELVTHTAAVVQRYGGTVDKFTGDGVMAVFGAPSALEDHALRACLAALGIQAEVISLAAQFEERDGIDLRLRVGLNSGQVIAGEIGSAALGYTAIGEQVGMAQRMESVAPPGGVMLSNSTARLVEGVAVLDEPQLVHIKGVADRVPARRLRSIATRLQRSGATYSTLVGRDWELATLSAMLDRSMTGRGCVIGVVGPPGIGKSRLIAEAAALAKSRGVAVYSTFCESHATDVPFHVVARLLSVTGPLEPLVPDADPQDLLLLDDLLGTADPDMQLPKIDPDARRRRLTALINAAQLARTEPAVFIIEDAHWIDAVSESMLAEFLSVVTQTPALVLVTYRTEYHGALTALSGAQTIPLAPLSDSETATLLAEMLGDDPTVDQIGKIIAARAAGNPFFAEEITRELAERGVLVGERGNYVCQTDVAEVSVPATLQATIGARIDRLSPPAKHTLGAAAVVGSRFSRDLLTILEVDPVLDELIDAELVDQLRFTPPAEYGFRHPLIRTVAYESQLKSDRARLHRLLATAIEAREPESADQNSALIAEHLEAADDLHAAYACHMRAATWLTSRDIVAARSSWERARAIADSLPNGGPNEDPNQPAMRIAPRTMLCATTYRVRVNVADAHFDELRQLCNSAGDKASLAIAMAGMVMDHAYQGRIREASCLASEAVALIESLGDPTLTVGLSFPAIYAKIESGEWHDVLHWSQNAIDLAAGDPAKGNFIFGSPLALAFTSRAMARYCLGRPEWRDDLRHGLAMARGADPLTYAAVVAWGYFPGVLNGALVADDSALDEIKAALRIAERSGNDTALAFARVALGFALVHRRTTAERDRGHTLLAQVSDAFGRHAHNLGDRPLVDVYVARELARRGDRDEAIQLMCASIESLVREGQLLAWGIPATGVLVETLLDRAADGDSASGPAGDPAADRAQAEAAIDRLAAAAADGSLAVRDVLLLRLRAMLARAHGDTAAYALLRDRYRELAKTFGLAGHIELADAMR